ARIDPARTGYLVVSKSGSTAETLCQFAIVFDHWRQAATGREAADHFVAITVPDASPLRRAAARLGFPVLDHDPAVGGRFSILSLVGLLPAFIHGVDGRALREGAALVLDETLSAASALDAPPAAGAALLVGLAEGRRRSQSVLMPYIDVLFPFALWFRQLWAESLGKNGKGLTPIAARGAVDQHSQLQLYLDGPADKVVTMIQAAMGGTGRRIGPDWAEADSDLAYLGGRTMGDMMAAE
ncbi:MAG: glucose-6-phosphate isomerase, partial [Alphaproteobacteria bacterium]